MASKYEHALKVGDTIGRYRIVSVLGQGGFGITYEAVQVYLGKRVALKECFLGGVCERDDDGKSVFVMRSNREFFDKQKKSFLNEARKLAGLSNPHIVQVYDSFEENGTAYYAMDFIEGDSLSDTLEACLKDTGKPFSEEEVMEILDQMLDALDCIHHQKPPLCHLDIKPQNIMMRGGGKAMKAILVDFGASKYVSGTDEAQSVLSTSLSAIAFTPGYAPLEQVSGDRDEMGPWTDFYALGATLYKLLTGETPKKASIVNYDYAIDTTPDKTGFLPLPDIVSPRMRKLVCWMMSPVKSDRPQSVKEIRDFIKKQEEAVKKKAAEEEKKKKEEEEKKKKAEDEVEVVVVKEPEPDSIPRPKWLKPVLYFLVSSKPRFLKVVDALVENFRNVCRRWLKPALYFLVFCFVVTIGIICWIEYDMQARLFHSFPEMSYDGFENGHEYVDLGLPSGTKWATCNVGATKPEDYGGYYAWGETEEKEYYGWYTYTHSDGDRDNCHDLGSDIAGTQYDVAHVKWGGKWRMPTNEQIEELLDNCTYEWGALNWVLGGKFTGPNGKSIFLPAAGYRDDSDLYSAGTYGYYRSSTQSPSGTDYAYGLNFYSGRTFWSYYSRSDGQSVRPVSRN